MDVTEGRSVLRGCALAAAGAGLLFWLYTFYAIAQVPAGDGTGFQWLAVMPLGMIFLLLTLPSLVLSWKGRSLWLALVLATAGLIAFALLWRLLLSEFYHWPLPAIPGVGFIRLSTRRELFCILPVVKIGALVRG